MSRASAAISEAAGLTAAPSVSAFAPAKVNLYLHVVGRRGDGYHLLDSLVAFADIGDRLAARPAERLSLSVRGPEAAAIDGLGDDNLVLRAARLFAAAAGRPVNAALVLDKQLPVSSGIGGGSSDAAAALRIFHRLAGRRFDDAVLVKLAAQLGADVPVCLAARPAWVQGIGEQIEPITGLPPAGIVLANPRQPLATPAVFRARRGPFMAPCRLAAMPQDVGGLAAALGSRRNDLTEAAVRLAPQIDAVLQRLADLPGALLARMSGSGATCFALFADRAAAQAGARRLAAAEPTWWIRGGALLAAAPPLIEEAAVQLVGRDDGGDRCC